MIAQYGPWRITIRACSLDAFRESCRAMSTCARMFCRQHMPHYDAGKLGLSNARQLLHLLRVVTIFIMLKMFFVLP